MAGTVLTAGDTRPTRLTYKVSGQPVDITGYVFTLKIGYAALFTKIAVIADGPAGILEFQWGPGDLVEGNWQAEILVSDAGGKEKTHRIAGLKVEPRLG